jgi:type II secretion system protein N
MKDAIKERLKAIAPKVGLPLFYLFCLVLFARWTFPYDKLRDRVVLTFNQQQRDTNGQQELKIEELGPSWLSGLSAKGVHLIGPASEPGKPPSDLKLDEVHGSISLFGLLFGSTDVGVRVDGFGGTIKGDLDDSSKERRVELSLDSLDLGMVPPITQVLGVPVEGVLSGALKIVMPDAKVAKATGTASIDARDVAIGDGKAKLKGILALPRLVVGALTFSGDVKDGVLKVSKISAGGKDVEIQGEGRIQLRESIADSLCDLNIRFKINDAYRSKNETTKSLFGTPGSTMPALFELDPKVKQSKRADGFYGWHMHGPLSRADFEPAPFAGGLPATPGMSSGASRSPAQ